MTIKLRCKVCEEITEHDVLKRYRKYSESMIGGSWGPHIGLNTTKIIYKCTKCGRELKIFDVFLEWMRG